MRVGYSINGEVEICFQQNPSTMGYVHLLEENRAGAQGGELDKKFDSASTVYSSGPWY